MTERTLREKIAALKVGPYQSRIQHPSVWNRAITEVLALLDAHTAAQPAPDAAAEDELTLAAADVIAWFDLVRPDLSGPRIHRLRYALAAKEPKT